MSEWRERMAGRPETDLGVDAATLVAEERSRRAEEIGSRHPHKPEPRADRIGGMTGSRATVRPVAHFTPALFQFLDELDMNNRRDWFLANKERYRRDVQDPLVQFVADFEGRLGTISPHMVADPRRSGGSVFRIYRDVRFSKDKTPYKTNAGIHFRHEVGREVHGPGLYLHIEPGNVFAGAGLWRPKAATALQIRQAIVDEPDRWETIVGNEGFASTFDLEGESLKRAPRGFDPDHPHIEYLKLKSFVATTPFDEDDICSPDFIDLYADACRMAAPFTGFLTRAVGLAW